MKIIQQCVECESNVLEIIDSHPLIAECVFCGHPNDVHIKNTPESVFSGPLVIVSITCEDCGNEIEPFKPCPYCDNISREK